MYVITRRVGESVAVEGKELTAGTPGAVALFTFAGEELVTPWGEWVRILPTCRLKVKRLGSRVKLIFDAPREVEIKRL